MSEIKERPILFSAGMVKAIRQENNPKTQTRRIIKFPRPDRWLDDLKSAYPDGKGDWVFWDHDEPGLAEFTKKAYPNGGGIPCPYGKPGDHLWVRETWSAIGFAAKLPISEMNKAYGDNIVYKADVDQSLYYDWRPSIHMPRWASRITLEIVRVRVERVRDISPHDAEAEGIQVSHYYCDEGTAPDFTPMHRCDPIGKFRELWDSINARRGYGWDQDPWVWVIEFKRLPSLVEQVKTLKSSQANSVS